MPYGKRRTCDFCTQNVLRATGQFLAGGLLTLVLLSCSGPAVSQVAVHAELMVPGREQPLSQASHSVIPGRWSSAEDDLERSCIKNHWSMLRQIRTPRRDSHVSPTPATLIETWSLLPNGTQAYIAAWPHGEGYVAVAVKVGAFGNAREEKAYIRTLSKVFAMKPRRDRGLTFDMPTLQDYQNAGE